MARRLGRGHEAVTGSPLPWANMWRTSCDGGMAAARTRWGPTGGVRTEMALVSWLGRTEWARERGAPLRAFLRTESGSAGVLVGAIAAAVVWANVDQAGYESFWGTDFTVRLGSMQASHDLRDWINSGLMTLFFLVV